MFQFRFHDPGRLARKWGVWEEGLGPRARVCAGLAGRLGGPAWFLAQNQSQDQASSPAAPALPWRPWDSRGRGDCPDGGPSSTYTVPRWTGFSPKPLRGKMCLFCKSWDFPRAI